MRAIVLKGFGGLENLAIENLPNPKPEPGNAIIQVKAFGINHAEMHMRRGEWAEVAKVSCCNPCRKNRQNSLWSEVACIERAMTAISRAHNTKDHFAVKTASAVLLGIIAFATGTNLFAQNLADAAAKASALVKRTVAASPHALEEFPWVLRGFPPPHPHASSGQRKTGTEPQKKTYTVRAFP